MAEEGGLAVEVRGAFHASFAITLDVYGICSSNDLEHLTDRMEARFGDDSGGRNVIPLCP